MGYTAEQLRLAVGDDAWNAIPDARRKPKRPARARRARSVRNQQRQRIVLGGYVPAVIAAGFTVAETAALCVLAVEHRRHGRCDLTVGEIARLAGCGRTTVQNALAAAERWNLVTVERRRVARDRNLPNVVTIIDRRWLAWIRLGPSRPRPWGEGGFKTVGTTRSVYNKEGGRQERAGAPAPTNGRWCDFRGRGRPG